MRAMQWTLALALTAALLVGCGTKEADSPEDAVQLMAKSLQDNDKDQFMAVIECEDESVAEAFFEFGATATTFAEKMQAEYGEEAYDSPVPTDEDIEEMKIKVDGDKAVAEKGDMKFVKTDAGWKIHLEMKGQGSPQSPEMAKKMFGAMQKAMEEQMDNIGKEGYTADKIEQAIGKAMMGVMAEAMQEQMQNGMQPPMPEPDTNGD